MMVRHRHKRLLTAAVLSALLAWVTPAAAQLSNWFSNEVVKWIAQGKFIGPAGQAEAAAEELAGIQGDYDPSHYPVLSSDCAANPDCKICLKNASDSLSDEFFLGENNYVLYLRTMKKYEMMVALADAATSLPTEFARYAWLLRKGSPTSGMNLAKKQFVQHYGEAQKNHLENIHKALLGIANCEWPYHKDWFNRVGMPFYTQLLLRWTSVK